MNCSSVDRPGEEVTLKEIGARLGEAQCLCFRLDAFCDRLEPKREGQINHRPDNCLGPHPSADAGDKATVDLEYVEREVV